MNSENNSILLDQFVRLMKAAPHTVTISCVSKEVYVFSHKPTGVSFYVASEVNADVHQFSISFFQGAQNTFIAKVGPETDLYEILSTHLTLHNLNDLLDAQFKMDEYLQRVDTMA